MIRVIGIDPGTVRSGVAVLEGDSASPPGTARVVALHTISVPAGRPLLARVATISRELDAIVSAQLTAHGTACVIGIESQHARYPAAALALGLVTGAAVAAAARYRLAGDAAWVVPIYLVPPASARVACGIGGRAAKGAVQTYLARHLISHGRDWREQMAGDTLRAQITPDNADAAAVAVGAIAAHQAVAIENAAKAARKEKRR